MAKQIEISNLTGLSINDESITADFDDGRTLSIPISWYPRLQHGSQKERNNFQIIGNGEGLHWPDLDEDVSTEGLLSNKFSAISMSTSFPSHRSRQNLYSQS